MLLDIWQADTNTCKFMWLALCRYRSLFFAYSSRTSISRWNKFQVISRQRKVVDSTTRTETILQMLPLIRQRLKKRTLATFDLLQSSSAIKKWKGSQRKCHSNCSALVFYYTCLLPGAKNYKNCCASVDMRLYDGTLY